MSIHWSIRYSAFALSVWTLSLFFAGWREINTVGGTAAYLTLVSGVLLTASLLGLQGYWIYFEEKSKGKLRRKLSGYEALHMFIDKRLSRNRFIRLIQPVVSEGKVSDQ